MWSALFPGQGSQSPGMGKFLCEEFATARRAFEEASDILSIDFKKLCFEGSEADLALTENTQPCLLLVSTATYRVLNEEFGFAPKAAAGHSVGEYAAVVAAGSLPFSSAVRAVRTRGEAMQSAVPLGEGGMTAVMGLEPEQVFELCRWAEKTSGLTPVQPANINAPGQIVISGRKALLDWIPTNFKSDMFASNPRVKFIPLKVSAPFHCAMMKPAEEKMAIVLGEMTFADARFPVVQNVSAEPVTSGSDLRANLIKQVSAPVRWIECTQKLTQMGADRAIECGSGKVIAGLVKKISVDALKVFNINSMDDLKLAETQLKG
ncbi:MAG: ACP S-malonyltransferase [Bdellovibrionales bacterium]|nr:ACP S-malonyltransferase [Bdellovibrionales bacterium]